MTLIGYVETSRDSSNSRRLGYASCARRLAENMTTYYFFNGTEIITSKRSKIEEYWRFLLRQVMRGRQRHSFVSTYPFDREIWHCKYHCKPICLQLPTWGPPCRDQARSRQAAAKHYAFTYTIRKERNVFQFPKVRGFAMRTRATCVFLFGGICFRARKKGFLLRRDSFNVPYKSSKNKKLSWQYSQLQNLFLLFFKL